MASPNIAGAISAIVVFDIKGRVILSRDYRGDVEMKVAERFLAKVNELEEVGRASPVLYDNGVSYLYVQYSNLFVVALAKTNVNAASTLLFLHKLIEVFKHYFTELEEESLRDNFVIAYELLDEVHGCFYGSQRLTAHWFCYLLYTRSNSPPSLLMCGFSFISVAFVSGHAHLMLHR